MNTETTSDLIEAMNPREYVKVLPEALVPTGRKLHRLAEKARENLIACYRQMGEVAAKAIANFEEQLGTTYGVALIDRLAEAAELLPRTLRSCIQVAKMPPEEFEHLTKTPRITWSHVVSLLSVPQQSVRFELAALTAENSWSSADLDKEIIARLGNRREGSGRRPTIPKNLPSGLAKLEKVSSQYLSNLRNVLFCDAFDLGKQIKCTPPDLLSNEIHRRVTAEMNTLLAIVEKTADSIERLKEARDWIDQVLNRAKSEVISEQ